AGPASRTRPGPRPPGSTKRAKSPHAATLPKTAPKTRKPEQPAKPTMPGKRRRRTKKPKNPRQPAAPKTNSRTRTRPRRPPRPRPPPRQPSAAPAKQNPPSQSLHTTIPCRDRLDRTPLRRHSVSAGWGEITSVREREPSVI